MLFQLELVRANDNLLDQRLARADLEESDERENDDELGYRPVEMHLNTFIAHHEGRNMPKMHFSESRTPRTTENWTDHHMKMVTGG